MLVQKRTVDENSSAGGGPTIRIKVSHGSSHRDISLPAQSTFGDLKRVLANETGLEPKEQRLLFRGKEKNDEEYLHMVGVVDMSKVILLEDPASKERKLKEKKRNQCILNAYQAVAKVRADADKLPDQAISLETSVKNGTSVADKDFVVLTELLKLDAIEADGEAKVQRQVESGSTRSESHGLKAANSNPSSAVSGSAKWETFDCGVGGLSAPKNQTNQSGLGTL
ncbi:BAG family molecular chaperone regulator 4-like isoform X2 [Diospyros lotus]|nr:BAG family molecular chaperone regulator 4-like isoform X2 [Diospyros lotus]XP_052207706.1 BAG family molecular chaperone regulator 4-like isoform X2 [Diospyros lotus]